MESILSTDQNKLSTTYKIVAASLLWKENRSWWFQLLMDVLSSIQTFSIIKSGFSISSLNGSDGVLPKLLQECAEFFSRIDPLKLPLETEAPNIPLFVIAGVYFSLVLGIFGFVTRKYLKKAKIPTVLHNIWTYCAQLHHNVIFWAVNVFLISALISNAEKPDGVGIALFSLSITMLVLNNLFGTFSAMFCYDPFLSKNAFASYTSTPQILAFTFKAVTSLVLLFISDTETRKWSILVLSLAFTLWRPEVLFLQMPYYQFSTMKLMFILAGSGLAIALTTLIAGTLIEYDLINAYDIIFMEIVTLVLMSKLIIMRMNYLIYKYSSLPEKQMKSPRDVLKKMIASKILAENTRFFIDSESDKVSNYHLLFVIGKVSTHTSHECHNDACVCNYLCQNNKSKSRDGTIFGVNKAISQSKVNSSVQILEGGIKSFRQNNKLKILTGYILLKKQEKFCAALLTLFSVNRNQRTLHEEVLIFYLIQQLEEEVDKFFECAEACEKNNLNMKRMIDFNRKSDLLFVLIKKNIQSYLQLWDSYTKSSIPLLNFFSQSVTVEKEAKEIENVWNGYFANQRQLSLCKFLYATYLVTIRNLPSKAEKLIAQALIYKKNSVFDNLRLDGGGDVIFHISMARERLGRTLYVSKSISREFGWCQTELVNQNIKIIQPSYIKEKHDHILINHLDKSNTQPNQIYYESFLRRKDGYCVPVTINITIFPYVQNEPVYASLIQTNQIAQDFLVIDSKGSIEAFSEGIGKNLAIPLEKHININEICCDFYETSVSGSKVDSKTTFELLKDKKRSILSFVNNKLGSKNNKISYKARLEEITILDQHYIYVYLDEKKVVLNKKRHIPSMQKITKEDLLSLPFKRTELSTQSNNDLHMSEASLLFQSHPTVKKEKLESKKVHQINPEDSVSQDIETFFEMDKPKDNQNKLMLLNIPAKTKPFYKNDRKSFGKDGAEAVARSQAGSISSMGKARLNEKLEQAIYTISKEKYMKILNYLIALFAILCTGLMAFHLIDSQHEFNIMLEKIELITTFQEASFTIVNSDANIRQMDLYSRKFINENGRGTRDSQVFVASDVANINKYTNQILETFNNIDPGLQKNIYDDRIFIKGRESELGDHLANGIEILTELSSALNAVAHLNTTTFSKNQSDAKFILDNALNDPFLVSERVISALVEDGKEDLVRLQTKTITLVPVVVCGGMIVLILLLIDVKLYLRKREQFIEILLKIDQAVLQRHLKVVDRINYSLKNDTFDFNLYFETKDNLGDLFNKMDYKIINNQKFYKSKKRLNFELFRGIILTTLAIFGFISSFLVLWIKFNANLDIFLKKIDNMTEMYRLHTNFNLYNVAVLEYISENNTTTVKNRPIDQALKELLALCITIPKFLEQILVDNNAEDADPRVKKLVLGNACEVIFLPSYTTGYCRSITESIGTKGLVTMTTFLTATYQESKRQFDISKRSSRDANNVLNTRNRKSSQNLTPFFTEGIAILKNILKDDLREAIISYREDVIVISIIYSIVYLVNGLILSCYVWKQIKVERSSWRMIVRQIPLSIISSNKTLKTFIVRNCNKILDSFKIAI